MNVSPHFAPRIVGVPSARPGRVSRQLMIFVRLGSKRPPPHRALAPAHGMSLKSDGLCLSCNPGPERAMNLLEEQIWGSSRSWHEFDRPERVQTAPAVGTEVCVRRRSLRSCVPFAAPRRSSAASPSAPRFQSAPQLRWCRFRKAAESCAGTGRSAVR